MTDPRFAGASWLNREGVPVWTEEQIRSAVAREWGDETEPDAGSMADCLMEQLRATGREAEPAEPGIYPGGGLAFAELRPAPTADITGVCYNCDAPRPADVSACPQCGAGPRGPQGCHAPAEQPPQPAEDWTLRRGLIEAGGPAEQPPACECRDAGLGVRLRNGCPLHAPAGPDE